MIRSLVIVALIGVAAALNCKQCAEGTLYALGDGSTAKYAKITDGIGDLDPCTKDSLKKCAGSEKKCYTWHHVYQLTLKAAKKKRATASVSSLTLDPDPVLAVEGFALVNITEFGCAGTGYTKADRCKANTATSANLITSLKADTRFISPQKVIQLRCTFDDCEGDNCNGPKSKSSKNSQICALAILVAIVRALF